jgi:hypothetical protein
MTRVPDPADLRVALDQFGTDAKRWRECATTLGDAATIAGHLGLRSVDFGLTASVHSAYADLQQLIVDLLTGGAAECHSVAAALITARDTYQREEDANVHAIKGIW